RLAVDKSLVAHLIAGLAKQARCFPQVGTHGFPVAGDGVRVGRGEHFRRYLVAHAFQNLEFQTFRQASRGELGALKKTGYPLVLSKEELPIQTLEIKRQVKSKPNASVTELIAP